MFLNSFSKYNIADWFSFYRIAVAPLLLVFIILNQREIFTWLLLVSFSTDMIDGFLARKMKLVSARGSQLDSLGDQLTIIVSLIGIYRFEFPFLAEQYGWIILAFSPYILQMILAYRKYGRATSFHTYLAKTSALTQGVFVLLLLFFGPFYWLFYIMIVLSILETIEEIILIFLYPEWRSDVKGIYWALKK